jgi:bifunctional ADP-heptose synthase (sugar kinase/adenylyltransferase)
MKEIIARHITSKCRDLEENEIPWVRIADLEDMDLPRPVVLINGAFDVLSSGHMRIIAVARSYGKTVVCGLDSDAKVKASKGKERPIQTWIERASTLNFMPIDYVVEIEGLADMIKLVATIEPDYRVQGSEYRDVPTRFPWIPKVFVKDTGNHTTSVVERVIKAYELRNR